MRWGIKERLSRSRSVSASDIPDQFSSRRKQMSNMSKTDRIKQRAAARRSTSTKHESKVSLRSSSCALHPNFDFSDGNGSDGTYFFDRRWRSCQCHLKRASSNADVHSNYLYNFNNYHRQLVPFEPWYAAEEDPFQKDDFKLSRERLTKIAKCHHLPRIAPNLRRTTSEDNMCRKPNSDGRRMTKRGVGSKTMNSAGNTDTDSTDSSKIDEEDPALIRLMNEEDLSFQILRETETIHKYVASRGQREREQEIYEVLPSVLVIK